VNSEKIPVVLVVEGGKLNYLPAVIKNLSEHCNFENYFVICPERDIRNAQSLQYPSNVTVRVIDERLILAGLSFNEVSKKLTLSISGWSEAHLPGWYLQQFLKMAFSLKFPEYAYYLVWDADTIPIRKINFFLNGKTALTHGNEFHTPYHSTISRILPSIKRQGLSHISQHMMVKSTHMRELIDLIQEGDTCWWELILEKIGVDSPQQFSEYETYASYCLDMHEDKYISIERPWFRYGKAYFNSELNSASPTKLSRIYDYVAFENWDTPTFARRIRARILVFNDLLAKVCNSIIKNKI
jgi:hypothetical protein